MDKIILLDLFSGTGGFAKGLSQAGFHFDEHFFCEVDPHAIANYKFNFPHAKSLGSVTQIRYIINEIKKHRTADTRLFVTFGSPCQDFSLAGNRAGLEGQKSSLIKFAIAIIRWTRPDIYIWENVKGVFSSNAGADHWAIQKAFANLPGYRREQQLLNTSWILPQNRERIYAIGYLTESRRSFGQVFPFTENSSGIIEGATKATITRTLSVGGKSGGMHSSMTLISSFGRKEKEKFRIKSNPQNANCLTQRMYKDFKENILCLKSGTWRTHKNSNGFRENISEHSPTIPARAREDGSGQVVIQIKANTKQGYEQARIGDSINISRLNSDTRRSRVGNQYSHTLDCQANQCVVVKDSVRSILTVNRPVKRQNGRRFKENGDPSFTLGCQDQHGVQIGDSVIRRLTEIECERLQGFPDNWTKYGIYPAKKTEIKKYPDQIIYENDNAYIPKPVPSSQRYKLCGNAVTMKIVQLIGSRLIENYKSHS